MEYINNVVKMLKSKNLDLRFCQDYERCRDVNLSIQMAPPKDLRGLIPLIIAGLAPPPKIDMAIAAIEAQIKEFEQMRMALSGVEQTVTQAAATLGIQD